MSGLSEVVEHPVMRYHGGKFRLAPWIISHFPEHRIYVEPFGGAAGVLMQKPRSESEVYNEIDPEIGNVFKQLRDPVASQRLIKLCELTPFARTEFLKSFDQSTDAIEQARRTLFRSIACFGGASMTKERSGFRCDSKRKYGTASSDWKRFPSIIESFTERLSGVLIENITASKVISQHDTPESLIYCDPPYHRDTRFQRSDGNYRFDMTEDEHVSLLEQLRSCEGFVLISGYDHPLYREMLSDWTVDQSTSVISASKGAGIRTECLWMNPKCAEQQVQPDLFGQAYG